MRSQYVINKKQSLKSKKKSQKVYSCTSNSDRLKLAEYVKFNFNFYQVIKDGLLIKEAAKLVNINYNTAKTMIRIMKKDKRIYKKKKLSRSEAEDLKLKESYKKKTSKEYDLFLTKVEENSKENINNLKTCESNMDTNTYNDISNSNNNESNFIDGNIYNQVIETKKQINKMIIEIDFQDKVLEYLLNLSLQVTNVLKLNNNCLFY